MAKQKKLTQKIITKTNKKAQIIRIRVQTRGEAPEVSREGRDLADLEISKAEEPT